MLDLSYIFNNLHGAWQTMTGRPEGLQRLDISEAGFWRSFQSVIVGLPVMLLSWSVFGRELAAVVPLSIGQIAFRSSLVDLSAWFLPLVVFAFVAKPLRLSDRLVHYIVASNWTSAVLLYLTLPVLLIRLIVPEATGFVSFASLVFFILTLVLMFRMTHVALGQPLPMTIAVYLALLLLSLLTIFGLQGMFGLNYPTASAG